MFQISERHGERRLDAPEARPGVEAEQFSRLGQLGRHRAQRLIKAEGHVPGLAGEDGEHRGELGAQHAPRRQAEEKHHGDRDEPQDRHRLQDVEQRDKQRARARAFRGPGRIGEGEQQREAERNQHAQRRSHRILGQMRRAQRNGLRFQRGQRLDQNMAGVGEGDDESQHQQGRQHIPAARQKAAGSDRDGRKNAHRRLASRWKLPR